MTDTLGPVRPMEGQGAYNRSSRVQAAGLLPAVDLLERAAGSIALPPPPQTIVVADYGSSAGRNSLLPMTAAVRGLRRRIAPERAISVVHTDLPDNDFSALFRTLASDPDSYLRGDPAVFASAIGRSFYEQLLPSESVTLGWSSWAVQWLSRVPATIPDQVQVAYSRDPAARHAFARQAAEDWQSFLRHRSRELRPGGRLVVLTMAVDDNGAFGYRPLVEATYAALVAMANDGVISLDELRRMVIPTVGRSRHDLASPFARAGRFEDLAIEHLEVFAAEDHIWKQYEASGDAQAFAAPWAAFTRASVFPTLAAALHGDRDDRRLAQFFDRLEADIAERLAAAPERMLIPLAMLMVVKAGPVG